MKQSAIKIVATSYFMFSLFLAIAQPEVQIDTYKMSMKEGGWSDIEYLGSNDNGTYYILHPFSKIYDGMYVGSKDSYIGKVNDQMEIESFEILPLTYEDKERELEFALSFNGKSYLFTSFQNNQLQKTFLFAETVDLNTLKSNDDLKPIAEIDYSGESKYDQAVFNYRLSQDKSKILITNNLLDKNGYLLRFGFNVYDKMLASVKKVDGVLLDDDGIFSFQDYYVNNEGTAYLLTKYFDDKKELKNSVDLKKQGLLSSTRSHEVESNYDFKVLKFPYSSSIPVSYQLKLDQGFITSVDLAPTTDGNLMCLGFYSGNEDAIPDGVFTTLLNSGITKVINSHTASLENKFVEPLKYQNDSYKSSNLFGKKDDLFNFRFVHEDILHRPDGGFVMTAERTTTLTKKQNNGQSVTIYNVHHTDDIAIIDVDQSGNINWVQQLEKSQETTGLLTLYQSYYVDLMNDDIVIFHTDLGANNVKMIGKVYDTESIVSTINKSGEISQHTIFNSDKHDITIKATRTKKVGDSFITYGHNGIAIVGFAKVKL
jgi:hypothetical protein